MIWPLLLAAAAASLVAHLGVTGLRRWTVRRRMLDIPNERSSHERPTPRGGGLAIAGVAIGGWIASWAVGLHGQAREVLALLVGGGVIVLVSWLDDMRSLSAGVRFGTHGLAAVLAIWAAGYWQVVGLPLLGRPDLGLLGAPLTFLWIAGLTNAYNFMDGIDGIAGGQAVVAGIGWTLLGWSAGMPFVAVTGLLLAAGALGFLGHNWPPASIFMGDVGSAFLGYAFAVLTVIAAGEEPRLALAGVLLVWPFVFDTAFTFVRRLRKGENVLAAHRTHLYQRLVRAGRTHRSVTLLYVGLAGFGLLVAYLFATGVPGGEYAMLGTLGLGPLGLWLVVLVGERRLAAGAKLKPPSGGKCPEPSARRYGFL